MSIPSTSGIYKFTCIPTGRVYIGSAINLRRRHKNHTDELRSKRHKNSYFQRAWNKYGESAFEYEVIELVLESFLLEREQYWMDRLGACNRKRGFNILPMAGSRIGHVASEETRRKLSDRMRTVPRRKMTEDEIAAHSIRMRARSLPDDFGERVSRGMQGRVVSDGTRAKLSAHFKGVPQGPMAPEVVERRAAKLRGRKRDPEIVAKIALINTGKKRSEEARQRMSVAQRKRFGNKANEDVL